MIKCGLPISNRHRPFFEASIIAKKTTFLAESSVGNSFRFFNRFPYDAVERFDSVGGINCFTYLWRIAKQGVQVMPVASPAT